jgi:hypothetical protein
LSAQWPRAAELEREETEQHAHRRGKQEGDGNDRRVECERNVPDPGEDGCRNGDNNADETAPIHLLQ